MDEKFKRLEEKLNKDIFNSQGSTETCPKCNHQFKQTFLVLDGGSKECPKCHTLFHLCKGGNFKFGSPGPQLCNDCKSEKLHKTTNNTDYL